MTVICRSRRLIFIKTRKTAGTSIEAWLSAILQPGDMIATAPENRLTGVRMQDTTNATGRWPRIERLAKRALLRLPGSPMAMRLREHMPASDVRTVIGDDMWKASHSFCVERDPWDRLLSFWIWRQKRFGVQLSFDAFLDKIEADPDSRFVRGYSNFRFYSQGGELALSEVILYHRLQEGLAELSRKHDLSLDPADLPFRKGGFRPREASPASLRADQIRRIARLCAQEIQLFSWDFEALHKTQPRNS